MQNNHIASVTLYGAPRTASQARPESSSSSHWTSNQNHIPFWPVLNLVPLLTEPLTQSQILNQADLTQKNDVILAQLRSTHWTETQPEFRITKSDLAFINFSWWVLLIGKTYSFNLTHLSRHCQPNPDYPRTQDLVTLVAVLEHWCFELKPLKWFHGCVGISRWCCKLTRWRNLCCSRAQLFPVSIQWLHSPRTTEEEFVQTVVWIVPPVRCNGSLYMTATSMTLWWWDVRHLKIICNKSVSV